MRTQPSPGSSAGNGATMGGRSSAPAEHETSALLQRTLRVSWDPHVSTYSSQQLRDAFAVHGLVEDVIFKEQKKKRKASALVVMGSLEAAEAAANAVCGRPDDPLLVVPYFKVAPEGEAGNGANGTAQQGWQQEAGEQPSSTTGTAGPEPGRPGRSMEHGQQAGPPPAQVRAPLFPAFAAAAAPAAPLPAQPLFPSTAPPSSTAQPPAAATGAAPPGAAAGAGPGSNASSFGSFPSFSSFPGPCASGGRWAQPGGAPSVGSYEGSVLEKMRQREAERARLVAELEREDQGH